MSLKKLIALVALLAIIVFAGLVLINTFYPNDLTSGIYTFITVTVPAYLSDKLEWVLGSAGAVITVVGAASKKIGDVKDTATEQVSAAQDEADQAKNLASGTFQEVSDLKNENNVLKERVAGMESTRTEAEQLVSQQQEQIKTLMREKQEYKELLEKQRTAPEVHVK